MQPPDSDEPFEDEKRLIEERVEELHDEENLIGIEEFLKKWEC